MVKPTTIGFPEGNLGDFDRPFQRRGTVVAADGVDLLHTLVDEGLVRRRWGVVGSDVTRESRSSGRCHGTQQRRGNDGKLHDEVWQGVWFTVSSRVHQGGASSSPGGTSSFIRNRLWLQFRLGQPAFHGKN